MKKGAEYWEEIDMLLDDNKHGSLKHGSLKQGSLKQGSVSQGSVNQSSVNQSSVTQDSLDQSSADKLKMHDQLIESFIADEIERSSDALQKVVTVSDEPTYTFSRLCESTLDWCHRNVGFQRLGYALVLMGVLAIPMLKVLEDSNQPGSVLVGVPDSAASMALEAVGQIDHSKVSYGFTKSVLSPSYKAFATGVLHTDIRVHDLAGEPVMPTAYIYYLDMVNGEPVDSAMGNGQALFEQSVKSYHENSEHRNWFDAGRVVEYVYLASGVAMVNYELDMLVDALSQYKEISGNTQSRGQSEKYTDQHARLLMFADKQQLTADDIESIQEISANLKVLIQ